MDTLTKERLNNLTEKALRDNASDEELRELSVIVAETIMGNFDKDSAPELVEG